jgi:hypothetical protein
MNQLIEYTPIYAIQYGRGLRLSPIETEVIGSHRDRVHLFEVEVVGHPVPGLSKFLIKAEDQQRVEAIDDSKSHVEP